MGPFVSFSRFKYLKPVEDSCPFWGLQHRRWTDMFRWLWWSHVSGEPRRNLSSCCKLFNVSAGVISSRSNANCTYRLPGSLGKIHFYICPKPCYNLIYCVELFSTIPLRLWKEMHPNWIKIIQDWEIDWQKPDTAPDLSVKLCLALCITEKSIEWVKFWNSKL